MVAVKEEKPETAKPEPPPEPPPEVDWEARTRKAEEQLVKARTYLKEKREGKFNPRTLPTPQLQNMSSGGVRGSATVVRKFTEYMGEVDTMQNRGIERCGGGRPYPVMTWQQRAEAAEWSVT